MVKWNLQAPIYLQLLEHCQDAIVSGTWPRGSRIPSVRDLAVEWNVNPNTVQRCLTELESMGLAYTRRNAGRYVVDDPQRIEQERQKRAKDACLQWVQSMRRLGFDAPQAQAFCSAFWEERPQEV